MHHATAHHATAGAGDNPPLRMTMHKRWTTAIGRTNAQAVDNPPNHMDTTHSGRQSANTHENYYYYYYYYYYT